MQAVSVEQVVHSDFIHSVPILNPSTTMSRTPQPRYPSSIQRNWMDADVSTHIIARTPRTRRGKSVVSLGRKVLSPAKAQTESRFQIKKPSATLMWFLVCITGFCVHSFFVIETYLLYETATETVIETPKAVRPPATSVCFLLWHLLKNHTFSPDHPCRKNLKKRAAIEACVAELVKSRLTEILSMTMSPLDYLTAFELREVSNKWSTETIDVAKGQGMIQEYYNGPYRCIRFQTRNKDGRLSVSNLTKGYPKARFFVNASFNVNPNITPAIMTVRTYVHEPNTFPRGAITLPAILNVTREQLFIVSYRLVKTDFLPSPFVFKCIDYSGVWNLESREHCVDKCLTVGDKTLPFSAVITDLKRDCNLTTKTDEREEDQCLELCPVDCITRTFYTMLADSTDEEETLTVINRFQEPQTMVHYTPKLDTQSFIIYEAGIMSLWFSACIYFTLKDFYNAIASVIKTVFKDHTS